MVGRILLALLLVFGLTACNVEPNVDNMDPRQVRVASVSVALQDAERIERRIQSWDIGLTKERFAGDLRQAVTRELAAASGGGTRPVQVSLVVTDIGLHSTIPPLVKPSFIPPFSQIVATVEVADARTGELLLRRGFVGDDNEGDVTFGAVMRQSFTAPKTYGRAYRDVVAGFASDLRRELFAVRAAEAAQ